MNNVIESYRRVIKNAPVGSLLIDITGQVVSINDLFSELFELEQHYLEYGKTVFDYQPFVEAGIGEALRKCADTGNTAVTEHFFKLKRDNGV